jgi:hypothetical protein
MLTGQGTIESAVRAMKAFMTILQAVSPLTSNPHRKGVRTPQAN